MLNILKWFGITFVSLLFVASLAAIGPSFIRQGRAEVIDVYRDFAEKKERVASLKAQSSTASSPELAQQLEQAEELLRSAEEKWDSLVKENPKRESSAEPLVGIM